jgi:hypothetical protein
MFLVPLPCAGHLLFILFLLCLLVVPLNTSTQAPKKLVVCHALAEKKLQDFNP